MIDLYLFSLMPALAGLFFCVWVLSIWLDDASIVDSFWAFGYVFLAAVTVVAVPPNSLAAYLMLAMVGVWGMRLTLHLFTRWRREGADKRYIQIIGDRTGASKHIFTLWFVFVLQGLLILIIAAPMASALISSSTPDGLLLPILASIVFLIGFLFEAVGDHQLAKFKGNPDNKGKVLDSGLWRYTRHPNYFGDACVWWGIWLVQADITLIFAPLLMTFIVVKWSGKPLLERGLKKSRPDYSAYIERTSGFFPLPPKKS